MTHYLLHFYKQESGKRLYQLRGHLNRSLCGMQCKRQRIRFGNPGHSVTRRYHGRRHVHLRGCQEGSAGADPNEEMQPIDDTACLARQRYF